MSPPGSRRRVQKTKFQTFVKTLRGVMPLLANCFTVDFAKNLMLNPSYLWISATLMVVVECFFNIIIIQHVPYTEIDWGAYMQEVEGALNGTWDYSKLKGDTGPLVYPAGFVYIFSILYYITNYGRNIRLAQYIFCGIYLLTLALVFRLYSKSKKVPPYMMIFVCCTSYRIHSIYVLRLFNDPVAMLFLYASLNLFMDGYWTIGSIIYSFAVSVKMNILLFAPALLLAYIATLGLKGTIKQLSICAGLQVMLGAPFILTDPIAYLKGSFDLGRVFLYEWTVNWRFLPEDVFLHTGFHVFLLLIHIALLAVFSSHWYRYLSSFAKLQPFGIGIVSQLFLLPFFTANLIGVAVSRSLHYQFYVWYFHSLPYLLWCTPYSVWLRLCILGFIEMSWNTYPSTSVSSAMLHICHFLLIIGIFIKKSETKPSEDENRKTM